MCRGGLNHSNVSPHHLLLPASPPHGREAAPAAPLATHPHAKQAGDAVAKQDAMTRLDTPS